MTKQQLLTGERRAVGNPKFPVLGPHLRSMFWAFVMVCLGFSGSRTASVTSGMSNSIGFFLASAGPSGK